MPNEKTKPTIAVFTSDYGHSSIAEAVKEVLETFSTVTVFKEISALSNIYSIFYQFMPNGAKFHWKLSSSQGASQAITTYFKYKYDTQIEEFFLKVQPDLTISTYLMFNPAIGTFSKISKKPYINVLADPATLHPLSVDPKADINFGFDDETVKYVASIVPTAKCVSGGWLVRNAFEEPYNKKEVRKKLRLSTEKQTLLIVSGSEGTTMIMKVLPALINTEQPLQVIVACGSNTLLFKTIKTLAQTSKKMKGNTFIPLKYTEDIYKYMQAADLIIGKAGPNTLFEAIATETPFFAITHIAGQEDGNLDIIRNYKLGFVEENAFKAQKLLRELINDPSQYTKLEPHVKKMALHNKNAKKLLRKYVEDLLAAARKNQ